MSFPFTESSRLAQAGQAVHRFGAGVALAPEHPVVVLSWLMAGLLVAAGLGPWLSQSLGVMLPAFAIVRTSRRDHRHGTPTVQRAEW